jgi:alkylated DNA repair dioxygenase AlkB
MPEQLSFLGEDGASPAGLAYRAEFLGGPEEAELIARLAALPFAPFQFHGFEGKRRTVSFGWQYRFDGSGLAEAEPMPDWLLPVRGRAEEVTGAGPLVHALIIEYAEGAGIGWHRDRPDFGEVAGLSLGAAAPLRFRRRVGTKWERFTLNAEPRSLYHLTGPARHEWEHSIAAVPALRYSITLRTLRRGR